MRKAPAPNGTRAKVSIDEMARFLKRCRSAILRGLKRNHFSDENMPKCDGHYGAATQLIAAGLSGNDPSLHLFQRGSSREFVVVPACSPNSLRRPRSIGRCGEPKFHRDVSILFRPDDVARHSHFGHREGELMLFKAQASNKKGSARSAP